MPIPGPIRNFFMLAAMATFGITVHAQTTDSPGEAIAPTRIVLSGNSKNEPLTKGETIELTSENATTQTFYTGVFNFLMSGADHTVSLSFDIRDVGRYNGDYIEGQNYPVVSGRPVNGGPKGAYLTASVDGRGCNLDDKTVGQFDIQEYEWRSVYIPKGAPAGHEDPITKKPTPLPNDKKVGFAITRFKAKAELHCDGAAELFTAEFDFYGRPPEVPQFGLLVVGPAGDNCFNPNSQVGTGLSCSATPGGGDTGGSAG
jgi:hypothetical protein